MNRRPPVRPPGPWSSRTGGARRTPREHPRRVRGGAALRRRPPRARRAPRRGRGPRRPARRDPRPDHRLQRCRGGAAQLRRPGGGRRVLVLAGLRGPAGPDAARGRRPRGAARGRRAPRGVQGDVGPGGGRGSGRDAADGRGGRPQRRAELRGGDRPGAAGRPPDVRRALLVLHPGPPAAADGLEQSLRDLAHDPFTALSTPAGQARTRPSGPSPTSASWRSTPTSRRSSPAARRRRAPRRRGGDVPVDGGRTPPLGGPAAAPHRRHHHRRPGPAPRFPRRARGPRIAGRGPRGPSGADPGRHAAGSPATRLTPA